MKQESVKTKNGGIIKVNIFESTEEYVKTFGKPKALKNLNRITRVDAVNEANRKQSNLAKLKVALKSDPAMEVEFQALLKKYGIKG